jgi:hypothetical protein
LQSSNNCSHILTVIDRTSKWMEAITLVETSAAACAKALTFSWISRFGVPETITAKSWAGIHLKPLVSALRDVKHRASQNEHLTP